MVQFLLASPVAIAVIGLCAAGLAGFVWTQNGNKFAAITAIALVLVTLGLVVVSSQIETEEESITRMLHEVAEGLQRNDREFVFSHIHPQAAATAKRAKAELPRYNFSEARVTRIKSITIDATRKPESAVVEMNVVVALVADGTSIRVPRFVKLYLNKLENRWLVRDYEHAEATAGFRD